MKKGDKVRDKETGWTGVVKMPGTTIVQVIFSFVMANGRKKIMKSAWRVSDLEVVS
jgi:hypothetical protein